MEISGRSPELATFLNHAHLFLLCPLPTSDLWLERTLHNHQTDALLQNLHTSNFNFEVYGCNISQFLFYMISSLFFSFVHSSSLTLSVLLRIHFSLLRDGFLNWHAAAAVIIWNHLLSDSENSLGDQGIISLLGGRRVGFGHFWEKLGRSFGGDLHYVVTPRFQDLSPNIQGQHFSDRAMAGIW